MKTAVFLINILFKSHPHLLSINKSFWIRKENLGQEYKVSNQLSDLLSYFVKTTFLFVFWPFMLKKNSGSAVVIDWTDNKESNKLRTAYIKDYIEDQELSFVANASYSRLAYSTVSIKKIANIFRLYVWCLISIPYSIFINEKYSRQVLFVVFKTLMQLVLLSEQKKNYYFFLMFAPYTYTCILLADKLIDGFNASLIASNSPMYKQSRYTYLPNVKLKLCSKYQRDEYANYKRMNWIVAKEVELWGLEEGPLIKGLKSSAPIYDIGIYACAEWARDENFFRINSDKLKEIDPVLNTPLYKMFDEILQTVMELKEELGFSVKVYPHPYERLLKAEFNIASPYDQLLEKNEIPIDESEEISLAKIYESKVGVSTLSTIIFDRWHFDLKGLLSIDDNVKRQYNPRYLGQYESNFFKDKKDLKQKIVSQLNA